MIASLRCAPFQRCKKTSTVANRLCRALRVLSCRNCRRAASGSLSVRKGPRLPLHLQKSGYAAVCLNVAEGLLTSICRHWCREQRGGAPDSRNRSTAAGQCLLEAAVQVTRTRRRCSPEGRSMDHYTSCTTKPLLEDVRTSVCSLFRRSLFPKGDIAHFVEVQARSTQSSDDDADTRASHSRLCQPVQADIIH